MKTFEQYVRDLVPWWMLGDWGTFFDALGFFADIAWKDTREAARVRFADRCPPDALQYAAREAQVPTFLDLDTQGEIRTRIQTAWDWHAKVATEPGFDDLFAILGFDPDETSVLDSSNGPHWFTETWWSAFAIVTRNPLDWGLRDETWDEFDAAGLTWNQRDALGLAWDYTAPASLFSQLREFMWNEKWTHAIPAYFVCSFGTGHTWDSLLAAGSSWDDVAADFADWDALDAVDDVLVIQTSRYWDAFNLENGNAPMTWDQIEALGLRWDRMLTARA